MIKDAPKEIQPTRIQPIDILTKKTYVVKHYTPNQMEKNRRRTQECLKENITTDYSGLLPYDGPRAKMTASATSLSQV